MWIFDQEQERGGGAGFLLNFPSSLKGLLYDWTADETFEVEEIPLGAADYWCYIVRLDLVGLVGFSIPGWSEVSSGAEGVPRTFWRDSTTDPDATRIYLIFDRNDLQPAIARITISEEVFDRVIAFPYPNSITIASLRFDNGVVLTSPSSISQNEDGSLGFPSATVADGTVATVEFTWEITRSPSSEMLVFVFDFSVLVETAQWCGREFIRSLDGRTPIPYSLFSVGTSRTVGLVVPVGADRYPVKKPKILNSGINSWSGTL